MTFLVAVAAVHERVLAEDVLDRPPERLAAVDDEQDRLLWVQLGSTHYEVGVTLGSLAAIDVLRGDLRTAENRLRRALAIKEQTIGPDHPALVPTFGTLGVVRRRREDRADAQRLYERALWLLESPGLHDHPHVATLKVNLGRLHSRADAGTLEAADCRSPAGAV